MKLSKDYMLFLDASKSDFERLDAFIKYNEKDIQKDKKQLEAYKLKRKSASDTIAISDIMIEFLIRSIESSQRAINKTKYWKLTEGRKENKIQEKKDTKKTT